MQNNGVRYISSAALLTIAILVAINIHESEAVMTIAEIRDAMKPIGEVCIPETGVSKEVVAKTHEGVFPADPALQCYYACVFKMMELTNEDNQIDVSIVIDQIDAMLPKDLARRTKELSQACFDKVTSDNTCVISWEFTKCFYESDSSLYFFP